MARLPLSVRPRKFRNVPTGGFDSRKEAAQAAKFELLKSAIDPADRVILVERQVRYELLPAQKENGRCIERPVHYVADFRVTYGDGHAEVYDVKSPITRKLPAYVLKRKLLLFRLGIRLREL